MSELPEEYRGLDGLVAIVSRLRAPGGCPWDAEQSHASLVQYLIEETHELVDAIESGDRDEMIEELGDVLYQVLFHSDLAAHTPEENFTVHDVAEHMTAKMIARHPHVFGDREAETAADVVAFWDDLKAAEKPHRTSVLDGVPAGMPALALSQKLLGKAAKTKVRIEPAGAAQLARLPESEAELGTLLIELVALAAANEWDAERALRGAIRQLRAEVEASEAGVRASDELPE